VAHRHLAGCQRLTSAIACRITSVTACGREIMIT
jgi:hypothetical protein